MLLISLIVACTQQEKIVEECPENTFDAVVVVEPEAPPEEVEEPEDFSMWEGASLQVLSPLPSQLIPIGAEQDFHAQIVDAEGEVLAFSDITWTTDQSEDWIMTSDQFTDSTLPVGEHVLEAQAILPNNNRLTYALGGIRVQHPDAGTYSGTTTIDATITDWSGNETIVSCAGAAIVEVSLEGDFATGGSACILQLFDQNVETTYDFQIEVQSPDLGGFAIADLGITQRDFPLTGTIGNGSLSAEWSDTVYGTVFVEGRLDLQRISSN